MYFIPHSVAGCCNESTNDNCREKCIQASNKFYFLSVYVLFLVTMQVLQDGVLDDQALVHLAQPENCGPPITVSFANYAVWFFKVNLSEMLGGQ